LFFFTLEIPELEGLFFALGEGLFGGGDLFGKKNRYPFS